MVIAGAYHDNLEGDDLDSKVHNLCTLSQAGLESLCRQHGFCVHVRAGQVVAIPSGMLLVTVAAPSAPPSILRWGFASKDDTPRVKKYIAAVLQDYPHLVGGDFTRFLKYLQ